MVKALLIFLAVILAMAFLITIGFMSFVNHLAEPHCGNCKHYNDEIGACEKHCSNVLVRDMCAFWEAQDADILETEEGGQDNG